MSIKGGYKLVDFKNISIEPDAASATVIAGVYDAIESSYRKPIIITGLVVDDVEHADVWCNLISGSGAYTGMIDEYLLTITDDDEITLTTPESAAKRVKKVK